MTSRVKALQRAMTYTWVREIPRNSNRSMLIDRWNTAAGVPLGSSWCMSFVHSMYLAEGVDLGGGASVGAFEDWAKSKGELVARPFAGDLVCYDWNSDHWPDHVGIVVKVLALRWRSWIFTGWVKTVEGNTSSGLRGSQTDGDGVYIRRRWIQSARFVRIPDPPKPKRSPAKRTVKTR